MTRRKDAIADVLAHHQACPEAVVWARGFDTFEQAWQSLDAPDWALWALSTFGYRGERELRRFAATCAARSGALWDDPERARAIDAAHRAADGLLDADELASAYLAAKRAAARIVGRADYTESMAAAAAAAVFALRDRAMDAAMGASRESSRAVAWNPDDERSWNEEGAWQSAELRRIVGDDVHALIAEVRKSHRPSLRVL